MSAPTRAHRGRSISVVGVLGEILLTAGVLVLLFIGWQNVFDTWLLAPGQNDAAAKLGQQWLEKQSGSDGESSTGSATGGEKQSVPVAGKPSGYGDAFAVMYVPRFGADWKRTIREGTGDDVLASDDAGVGHYESTAMPGAVGNFAVAAHDTGYGNSFLHVQNLRLGDKIYVQTPDGFYTYTFRNYEYVSSSAVQVLLPVPTKQGAQASDRILTMTTCNPPYHQVERIIAYSVLESFSTTPPKAIAGVIG